MWRTLDQRVWVETTSDEILDLAGAIGEFRFEVGRLEAVEVSYPKSVEDSSRSIGSK